MKHFRRLHGFPGTGIVNGERRPRMRRWVLLVAIIGLIAGHSIVLYEVLSRTRFGH